MLTTALALLTTLAGAAFPAHAATGYRYWSFWERSGAAWTYATRGPAISRPGDGSVEGFRFSVSEDSRDSARPRGTASFGRICADTPERADRKRIAVVLDFGTAADAPSGEIPPKPRTACARIDRDGSAADALAAVAKPLRYDASALLCAISGYPRTGCGEQVDSGSGHREGGTRGPAPHDGAAHAGDGGDGPSVGLFAGIGVLVVLAAGTVWQTRRRRRA
ncbi:SCO2322 family protein [Streptomyces sp. NPDC007088]|uniref:SCO2322 family protein n=1 Tax=Streptomyces sp. NPDC007088 TaxID=3364773 RepID=UPI0036C5B380